MRIKRRPLLAAGAIAALVSLIVGFVAVQAASPAPNSKASGDYGQVFIDKLAGILHLSHNQTADALKKAGDQTVDQMVKDGKITQAQADRIKSRIDAGKGFGFGHFGKHPDRGFGRELREAEIDAVAKALGMSPDELRSQLRSGKSLKDLEQAKGVSEDAIRTAVRDAAKQVLDKAVKDGKITQDQENRILEHLDSGRLPFDHKFGFPHRDFKVPAPTS